MIRIAAVMDNQPSGHKALAAQHGLSFYIQEDSTKILFDFGSGPEMWENGKKLNVPFEQISYAVFSHSHYDHSGGFRWAEGALKGAIAVYGREDCFFQEKYAVKEEHPGQKLYTYLGCGFSKEYVRTNTRQQLVCEDCLQLAEGCWAVGNFQRTADFEQIPPKYVKDIGGSMIPDLFQDEICLALEIGSRKGLAVIAGCSHPGIVNMLRTVEARLHKPVRAVIGGVHLSKAEDKRISRTVQALRSLGVGFAALNHCSGDRICRELEAQGIESCRFGVGDCLYL